LWTQYPDIYKDLIKVEDLIKENTRTRNKQLQDAVDRLFKAGGKRLRPAFVIISSKFGKPNKKKVISAAGAIEILHAATLVHDDIIDRSALRRGKPTVNETYGPDIALYCGDFLFTKSILTLSKGIPTDNLELVAKSIKTICEGEIDQYYNKKNPGISVVSYLKSAGRKTAVMFGAACGLGAYLSKCSPNVVRVLTKFGYEYGIAFQIKDDLNDFLKSEDDTGKALGKDLTEGFITLPIIFAIKENNELHLLINNVFTKNGNVSSDEIKKIIDILKKTSALDMTHQILEKYIDKATKLLTGLPENKYKTILFDLLNSLR
jgi:heptaprenyl diphosphate synthase